MEALTLTILAAALAGGLLLAPAAQAGGLSLTSPAFDPGGDIPVKYTCDGEDISPPLRWTAPPEGTRGLALICEDPDAPGGLFVHWVLWNLDPSLRDLPAEFTTKSLAYDHALEGANDFGKQGYGGPCPPPGPAHRYYFKLYALDAKLDMEAGADRGRLLEAMEGHVLEQAEHMGRYARQ
jgi:hypothetical protein